MSDKKIKPAALIGTSIVTVGVVIGWLTFDIFEKKTPKECEPCKTDWLAYVAAEGEYYRKVDKKILRYRYKKNAKGEKVCMVWGSDHVWYELLPGQPDLPDTILTIDPNFPSAYCDWE